MAIDSSGSGSGVVSQLRDTITALRGLDTINRINPSADDPDRISSEDSVRVSETATTDPRILEQQQLDTIRQGLSNASAAGNVALAGSQAVSGTLDEIGTRLQQLTDTNLSQERRTALAGEIDTLVRQGLETVDQASFNGVNLLDAERNENLEVVADREGNTETVRDQTLQTLNLDTAEGAQSAIDGVFADARTATDIAVRQLTEDNGRVGERLSAIQDRQTDLAGTDPTVEPGLDSEGAQQTAQQLASQLQQALGDQNGLGIVNARPETLVGLFR
jgi:flagellin-like hook-associated protein FlgL